MSGNTDAIVRRTDSKKGSPWKTLVYTQHGSDSTEKLQVPRSACVTKGDTIEIINDKETYVYCKHGKAQILPSYFEKDEVRLGDLTIPVSVKEITKPEEYEAYHQLQFHHYRGKSLFGRHAPLVMCATHPLLPSVVGYIELATPFLVSKPRHEFFNTSCQLNGIGWEQWNNETLRKHISLFVRIARCVVHPELRGAGIGQKLVKHSVQFAQKHWQSGGRQPYVLEICADMLRYIPFAENAGMIYIGETEGNAHRIAKDFSYFIKHLERFENKEILPDDSCGIYWIIDYRIYDYDRDGKTKLQHLEDMLRNAYFVKCLPFRTVLIDSWYASMRVMKSIQALSKIYYAPLKCNRLVNDSDGVAPHKRVDTLTWTQAELRHGKLVHIKKFPRGQQVKLFRIASASGRTEYISDQRFISIGCQSDEARMSRSLED